MRKGEMLIIHPNSHIRAPPNTNQSAEQVIENT